MLETLATWEQSLARPTDASLREEHGRRASVLSALDSAADVLIWHGGKDLLAALAPEIRGRYRVDPKTFRHRLRDWVRDNPGPALERLPEWSALFAAIAAVP